VSYKKLSLRFEPIEKERMLTAEGISGVVDLSREARAMIAQQKQQGYRFSGVVKINDDMFCLMGFCNRCGLMIVVDEERRLDLPDGLAVEGVVWCSKCYFEERKKR